MSILNYDLLKTQVFSHATARDHRVAEDGAAAPPARARVRALGINAKSFHAFEEVLDEKTGEFQRFRRDSKRCEYVPQKNPDQNRFDRYALQKTARLILQGQKNPKGKDWRTVKCLHTLVTSNVSILYVPRYAKARFGGLATCGSVWTCPICSSKISERRKLEITSAADLHKEAAGGLYLVTMTWGHRRHDNLHCMVKKTRLALARLRKQRSYVQNARFIDTVGMVRSLEVTHGESNGWHPHFHELWFLKNKLSKRQLSAWKKVLFKNWHRQCLKSGLGLPNRKFGVTIFEAESAAEYVAKFGNLPRWDIGSELAKHQLKNGRNGGRTPWDLLRLYSIGETRFFPLFLDYANSFFGARQVFWSTGLKQVFGIQDLTDEELAALEEERAHEMCQLTKDEWRNVLSQTFEARSLLLKLAETGGVDALKTYLSTL